ncbi:hypothetical protein Golomagni_04873 [Golovinomyces magnicellulatus]|nr:hypothetical protein Golomagni_04873 [Golovinomyces magnicellulatus]
MDCWSFRWLSALVAEVTLNFGGHFLRVVNIYSPITSKPEITGWDTIAEAIRNNTMSCVIVGDFNCHHPLWGGITAPRDNRAEHLLHSLTAGGLNLITPTGIPTFRRRGRGGITQETVIDLAFVTEDLLARVNCCTTREDWSLRNDHIPIDISLDLSNASEVEYQRYAYEKADIDKIKETIRQSNWYQATDPLTVLQKAIVDGLLLHCPKRRSSIPARAEWSPKATILLSDTRKARRQALQTGEVLDNLRYKQLRKELKKEIRNVKRSGWRKFVEDVTGTAGGLNNKGLWRLLKWGKKTTNLQQGPPHLPALRRSINETLTNDNHQKEEILRDRFFPGRVNAELSDIEKDLPPKRLVPIDVEVTSEEIENVLRQLPRGKAPGPDEIPNEILQLDKYPTPTKNL